MYNLNEFVDNYVEPELLKKSVSSFDNYILVHNNYKGQLKAYSKKNFDPF